MNSSKITLAILTSALQFIIALYSLAQSGFLYRDILFRSNCIQGESMSTETELTHPHNLST